MTLTLNVPFTVNVPFKDLPTYYCVVNLVVTILDAVLFFLWGNSIFSVFAWIRFTVNIIRVIIAVVLCMGVKQRNVSKCKAFCTVEWILLIPEIVFLFAAFRSIGRTIWILIVIGLQSYGTYIIARFTRVLLAERGERATYPWLYFPDPGTVPAKSTDAQSPM